MEAIQPCGTGVHCVGLATLGPGSFQAVGIVLEFQGIGRAESGIQLAPGPLIGQKLDIIFGADSAVPTALGTDVECLLELLPDVDMAATVTLLPGVGRNFQPFTLRRPWLAL